jgi:mannose-6-phosphate isomerase-like protein (cupin superfamily)
MDAPIFANEFVVAEWRDAGGPPGPPRPIAPLHVHYRDDEAWYVLEGALCVQSGGEVIEARTGGSVLVARGTPHTYWNPGPGLLRYLLIMTPNIYGLIQDIHALRDRTPGALREVFQKHDSAIIEG